MNATARSISPAQAWLACALQALVALGVGVQAMLLAHALAA